MKIKKAPKQPTKKPQDSGFYISKSNQCLFDCAGVSYRAERFARYISVAEYMHAAGWVNVAMFSLALNPGANLSDKPTFTVSRAELKPLCKVSRAVLFLHVKKLL